MFYGRCQYLHTFSLKNVDEYLERSRNIHKCYLLADRKKRRTGRADRLTSTLANRFFLFFLSLPFLPRAILSGVTEDSGTVGDKDKVDCVGENDEVGRGGCGYDARGVV